VLVIEADSFNYSRIQTAIVAVITGHAGTLPPRLQGRLERALPALILCAIYPILERNWEPGLHSLSVPTCLRGIYGRIN
jgi:hypothetical protein